jgi:hypothetical protein
MKLAIMQPYFLPYIGYFQLIAAADIFVVYDNIKYTKKGWINRNRFLQNGKDVIFSLPLKKSSDSLNVVQRELAADFNRDKLLNIFEAAYRRAPYLESTRPLLEHIVRCEESNLFYYLHHSIVSICQHLNIDTDIRISSEINIDSNIKGQDKVIAISKALGASTYINSIGGIDLYSKTVFQDSGINLNFIKSQNFSYTQFGESFVPWLSIVDLMMFNPKDAVRHLIHNHYELI